MITQFPFLIKFQAVIAATNLSEISKQQYQSRLKRLTDITKHDIDWVLINCDKTLELLQQDDKTEPQTLKSFTNSVLAVFKYTQGLKQKYKKYYLCWSKARKDIDAIATEKYKNIQPSDKQIENYVPWADIIATRDQLPHNSNTYLLLSLYTMIPPGRADFNNVKILYKQPTEAQIRQQPNYLIINDQYTKLVFNEFKTKSKKIQTYENILPDRLVTVILNSLKHQPRDFLVVSPRNGKPYLKPKTFTTYIDRMLHKLFHKNVTINTLRHSFIMSLDFNKLTPKEKEHIAYLMMHSVSTQDTYRFAMPAKANNQQQDKLCTITCTQP